MNEASDSLKKAGRNMREVGQNLSMRLTAPLAAVSAAVVKVGMDFEDSLNQSIAIMGDVSDAMRNKMAKTAQEVAGQLDVSNKEAAESYFYLASAGLDAEQSIAALEQVAEFATAGQFDMEEATDLLTDAQSALGLTVDDATENMENMAEVSDILVKANTLANASVQQFSEALTNKAAAGLRNVNKSLEEGAAVLAVFADQGVKGSEAGTQLSRTLRYLQQSANNNKDAWEKNNISIYDANGNMKNMADIVEMLTDHMSGMTDEQRAAELQALGFNAKTQDTIKLLMGTSDQIREYQGELEDAGGTTQSVAEKQMESLKKQLGLIIDKLKSTAIQMYDNLKPTIENVIIPAINSLIKKLEDVTEWFGGLSPKMQKTVLAFVGLAAALGPVLIGLGLVASSIGSIASIASTAGIGSISALAGTFAPFLVGGVIAAGIVGIVNLFKRHRKVARALKSDVENLTKAEARRQKQTLETELLRIKELEKLAEEAPKGAAGSAARTEAAGWQDQKERIEKQLEKLDELIDKEDEVADAVGENIELNGDYADSLAELNSLIDQHGEIFQDVFGENVDISKLTQEELLALWMEHYDEIEERILEKMDKEVKAAEKTEEAKSSLEQKWTDKLFAQSATRLEQLEDEKENAIAQAKEKAEELELTEEETEQVINTIKQYYSNERQNIIDEEMKNEEEKRRERLASIEEFEQKWTDKLFEQSATRIEKISQEEQEAIQAAEDKAAELEMSEEQLQGAIIKIQKYYQNERQQIREEELKKEEEKNRQLLESKEEYISNWEQKLFEQNATEIEMLEQSKTNALKTLEEKAKELELSEEEIEKIRTDIKQYYSNERQRIEEREKEELLAAQREFKSKWEQNLFEQNATELELLEREKENAIASAREKAEKLKLSEEELQQVLTQIKRYYSNKREKIEQEEKENLLSSQEEFKSKWEQKLFEQNATELEILRRNKQNVLQIAKEKAEKLKITEEEWQTVKNQIVQYYSNEEERIIEEKNNSIIEKTKQLKEKMGNAYKLLSDDIKDYMLAIKDNTEVAAESAADAIVSFVDTVASGQKSLKEAIKDMTLSLITSFEKQVIAAQLTAEGIAAAMAVWDFGAALARFFAALPKILATLAAFEALKAGIRGLETGGLVTAPTLAMVGEGLNDEAVIPLNSQVFSQLADGITSKMNTGNSPLEIDVTINQNINNREDADRAGDSVVSSLSKKLQDRGVVLANR